MKLSSILIAFFLLFASGQQVLRSQQSNPPEEQGKKGIEFADKDFNDYLFKEVDGQAIRVKGQKTLFFNGDSIMSGLASRFKGELAGEVNALYRKDIEKLFPDVEHKLSCTATGLLQYARAYIDHPDFQVDLMMLNAGIHDAIGNIPPETYAAELESLIELAHRHKIPLIWVNTIPITDQIKKHPRFRIIKSRMEPLNEQAAKVMEKHHIPVIDLNGFMQNLIETEGLEAVYRDAYHQKPEFAKKQGDFVAGEVLRILNDSDSLKKQLTVQNSNAASPTNEALVFLIAGQSNAGGVAAFSPETNEKAGMAEKHPTVPGSTAREVGIPTTMDAYPRCYIWAARGFERLKPGKNLKTGYRDPMRHGIELPMAMLLQDRYPSAGIYFIKHGPGGHNLHTQWKAGVGPDYQSFMAQFTPAMTDLKKHYEEVRVIGLYWDQGESDRKQALQYEDNLRTLFSALRKDTGIPELQIYVREQGIFQHDKPDFQPIVEAQIEVCREDPNAHLFELDLGSNEKNFKAWAWTDRNGHLSSKAYLELSKRICRLTD